MQSTCYENDYAQRARRSPSHRHHHSRTSPPTNVSSSRRIESSSVHKNANVFKYDVDTSARHFYRQSQSPPPPSPPPSSSPPPSRYSFIGTECPPVSRSKSNSDLLERCARTLTIARRVPQFDPTTRTANRRRANRLARVNRFTPRCLVCRDEIGTRCSCAHREDGPGDIFY